MKQKKMVLQSTKTITADEIEDDLEASDMAIETELRSPIDVGLSEHRAMRCFQDLLATGLHEETILQRGNFTARACWRC